MVKRTAKTSEPRAVFNLDVHHRIAASALMAVVALVGMHGKFGLPTELIVAWNAFALTMVILAWIVIATRDPYEVRRNVRLQDSSATFLFTLIIFAAFASLLAVGFLLYSAKHLAPAELAVHMGLSILAVFVSWGLVHTIFSLRYAHIFYMGAHKVGREDVCGGLDFPGDTTPDYLDFAYFSFVIGMTCQVSDVPISSKHLRRLALLHGLISFAFNTAILAMFVNIIAGLV